MQNGTHFDMSHRLFADESVCLTALPPWLDEHGSNRLLFAAPLPPVTAEEDHCSAPQSPAHQSDTTGE